MSYTKMYTCSDEIDKIINLANNSDTRDRFALYYVHRGISFLVHESIFDKFITKMTAMRIPIHDEHVSEFTLHIGNNKIPMFLFWFKSLSDEYPLDTLNALIIRARVSFIWETHATLFTPIDEFGVLEQFIADVNLSKSIRNVYVDKKFAAYGRTIKVVEFNETVRLDIGDEFIRFQGRVQYPANKSFPYYIIKSFHFQCLEFMKYFDKPFHNPDAITQVLLLLDYHRQMARKGKDVFNMFDMIALKHAIDNPRFEYINCEFLKLMNCMMANEVRSFIVGRQFNLAQYMANNGVYTISAGVYQYLVHEFQHHFDRFIYTNDVSTVHIGNIPNNRDIDKFLVHAKSCNVYLDGWGINNQTRLQFIQNVITQTFRVKKIILDSNNRWNYDRYEMVEIPDPTQNKLIESYTAFVGHNQFCFVENFLNWLRASMPGYCRHITLEFVGTPIRFGSVFRRLHVHKLIFHNIEINLKLLRVLQGARWERICFSRCKLQNKVQVVADLEALDNIVTIELQHEEHTFELLLRYVELEMHAMKSREFVFRNHIIIEPYALRLKEFKFHVNRDDTKIEAHHYKTRRSYDLYEFMVRDDAFAFRDAFEFYQ